MTVGSLFSGIGGLDLGLEWAGFETVWFCEIEKFPQAVLRKHWPDVPIIEDVRDVTSGNVQRVDVIAGGFPCQDISWAGKGRGIDYDLSEQEGTRSGLWWEMWRVIRDLRPRYVIAENVPALTHRGLDIVLGSLAEIGYDAEWQTVSAAGVGAPHIRERVFIVAYPTGARAGRGTGGVSEKDGRQGKRIRQSLESGEALVSDTMRFGSQGSGGYVNASNSEAGADRKINRAINVCRQDQPDWFAGTIGQPWPVSFKVVNSQRTGSGCGREQQPQGGDQEGGAREPVQWVEVECEVCGVADGIPGEVDDFGIEGWAEMEYGAQGDAWVVSDRVGALKGYGNAVVPHVGYLVGRAVRAHAEENGWWT